MQYQELRKKQLRQIREKLERDLNTLDITLKYKPPTESEPAHITIIVREKGQNKETTVEFSFELLKRLGLKEHPLERKFEPESFTWESVIQLIQTMHNLQKQP
ncbi:MAG: hypothetical protein U9M98_03070 [Patescibacteria group bacterium]|nr:hypothetical protein [Patescibacteria group bacterium]